MQYPDAAAFDARTGAATALAVAGMRAFQRGAGGVGGAPQCACQPAINYHIHQ